MSFMKGITEQKVFAQVIVRLDFSCSFVICGTNKNVNQTLVEEHGQGLKESTGRNFFRSIVFPTVEFFEI